MNRTTRLVATCFFVMVSTIAEATPILDANYQPSGAFGDGGSVVASIQTLGQTFTVGLTGLLTDVDVLFERYGAFGFTPPTQDDLLISIWTTSSGLPDARLTADVVIPIASIPIGLTSLQISEYAYVSAAFALPVTAGQVLAIVAMSNDPNYYAWYRSFAGTYAGGIGAYRTPVGAPWQVADGDDFPFRTYVDPAATAPVPEPTSLALVTSGAAAYIASRRRVRTRLRNARSPRM